MFVEKRKTEGTWQEGVKSIGLAMVAEIDLTVLNLVNIFFCSRFLGADGAAAYEVVTPCLMFVTAFIALGYNGVQAVCAKDYGAEDMKAFERHKNAGYTWFTVIMVILVGLLLVCNASVLDLLGANDGSEELARLSRECYMTIILCFIPQTIFSLAACFMYLENHRQLLISNLILYGCILTGNVIVTLMMPSMTGYMAVNAISLSVADAYIIFYFVILHRNESIVPATTFNLHLKDIKEVFFTGLPDFAEYGFVAILYFAENHYVLFRFSESLMAGIGAYEAIDNLPEVVCVGFCFLVTGTMGKRIGRIRGAATQKEREREKEKLIAFARRITLGGVIGSVIVSAMLLILAYPLIWVFLPSANPLVAKCVLMLTVSCATGFGFYMLNSEFVCYYKLVGAYVPAHIVFLAEALVFPLCFEVLFGELFGVTGFCMGSAAGQVAVFLLNLGIVWHAQGRFPRKMSDFVMDKYLQRILKKKDAEVKA